MKNLCYVFVLIFFSIEFKAQTVLTNGMVYNYTIGDTIKFDVNNGGGPSTSYTRTILQKTVMVDTILYQFKDDYYTPPACMSCSATIGTSSYSFQVTGLNTSANHITMTNTICTVMHDSIYANGCGQTINERYNVPTITCFEPDMYTSYLVEGVGSFYQKSYGSDPNHSIWSRELTYYHKVGQLPCGGNGMPLSLTENDNWSNVFVYPNPNNGLMYIELTDHKNCLIEIYDVVGKKIKSINMPQDQNKLEINLSDYSKGLYLINGTSDGKKSNKKIIVE